MNRLFLFTLLSLFPLLLPAQERWFVDADSVLAMDVNWNNFRHTAMFVDARLKAKPVVLEAKDSLLTHARLEAAENATDSLYTAAKLFLLTGKGAYMDIVEHFANNHFIARVDSCRNYEDRREAAQVLLNLVQMQYAQSGEGIYVNLYLNTMTHFLVGGKRVFIDQVTQMPHFKRVRLRFDLPPGVHPFTVFLRIPEWAEKPYKVYTNGKELPLRIERDGYILVRNRWTDKDEIFFDFPNLPEVYPNY